tara:strand:+ start:151 stop:843 length:693 start_codon:yes stop_codon:yes gene_type:complete
MLQSINKKKILFYIIIFFILSTINNITLTNNREKISSLEIIEVRGLSDKLNYKIKKDLDFLVKKNIYQLDSKIIKNKLDKYNFIENYKVIKNYPSKLIVDLEQTIFIAKTYKNNQSYIIGSNGKFINYKIIKFNENIPNVFGNFTGNDVLDLKRRLINSKLKFDNIQDITFQPSGRWDIKTKNNLIVKLPKKNIDQAINKFNLILKSNELKEFNMIDLRIQNQIILSNEK